MAELVEDRIVLPALADDNGEVTADKIVFAVQKIVELANPIRVVAFGSRARGNHRPDSDLDLAVIVEKYDPKVDKCPLWRSDLDVWMPIDLLVFGRERHEFMKDSLISVNRDVETEGITLYDRSNGSIDRGATSRLV
jgi:predicted nucleotidyltransferase